MANITSKMGSIGDASKGRYPYRCSKVNLLKSLIEALLEILNATIVDMQP